jgi:hypothetical protein
MNSTTHTFYTFLNNYQPSTDPLGYTDDTAMGILGLQAADVAANNSAHAAEIQAAKLSLSGAVDINTGITYDHVSDRSYPGAVFAGDALLALTAPEPASIGLLVVGAAGLLMRRRKAT